MRNYNFASYRAMHERNERNVSLSATQIEEVNKVMLDLFRFMTLHESIDPRKKGVYDESI